MRNSAFILSLVLTTVLAGWFLMRMVINTDPEVPANVMVVLLLLFLIVGSLTSLLSWGLIRRLLGTDAYGMSIRHGFWAGLFLIALPILRWLGILSVLVIGAILLVIFGLESLLLLQQGQEEGMTDG
ncbi:MAG: hypothetical protein H0T73_23070 [Ardenticatenales bacterium]|nr:hypothetical protein [Ardenticatenales bacterium]